MSELADVKTAARTVWALGDYDAMMRAEGLYDLGAQLAHQLTITPGERVVDVACGTGNAAIPAARAGGRVTGVDLTPEMLAVARQRAEAAGVTVDWVEGDAESLPLRDAEADVVLSTFGCMFAPRHEVVAEEIARVLAPGGRIGLCVWAPDGVFGEFFRIVAGYLPPDPEFVDPPLAWGDEHRVRELFEGTGITPVFERASWRIIHPSVEAAIACYTDNLGPVTKARELTTANGSWPGLHADLAALFHRHAEDDGRVVLPATYLVITGRRA
ncbi:methyltransferase domain-containing protein [Lipingzhangella sp. LS1_29]|uniref:Methyltransferase domain-containing protein n=1 Tax=Lipingzhangella rawalii TaxID=2055835 RepID=A0ABU2HAF5_9ACTN|nr:methyltransferase domain-containing protein [Lipingzhangella rawalii]MDS1272306.1 methyltransferase domain-containing protein [Lipingzhangella rawalii]